jgi:2'-5' RNA ligase
LRLRVESALAGHFKPESRAFRPHVTLARLKDADPAAVRHWLAEPASPVGFGVFEFVLFESRPGSVYEALAKYPLR